MLKRLYTLFVPVCLLIAFSNNLHAQCAITVDAGPNKFVCTPGETVKLDGSVTGDYIGFRWTPVTGLNDPTILNPTATVNGSGYLHPNRGSIRPGGAQSGGQSRFLSWAIPVLQPALPTIPRPYFQALMCSPPHRRWYWPIFPHATTTPTATAPATSC